LALGLLLFACGLLLEYATHRPLRHAFAPPHSTIVMTEADDDFMEEASEAVVKRRSWRTKSQRMSRSASFGEEKPASLLSAVASIAFLSTGLLSIYAGLVQGSTATASVPLIIDTDMSFDVDDVGAICIAHALMDLGEAELLAVVHSSGYPEGIGAASVINEWYGHSSVRLGAYKGSFGKDANGEWISGLYVPNLVQNFPSPVKNLSQVPESVEVYRQTLAEAADSSVAIAVIGFATNIAALLRSSPDRYSALSGVELVKQKVRLVVWQGGWYEPLHPDGHSTFNWDCGSCCGYQGVGCLGEAQYALQHMPANVEQIFTDLGDAIYHGGSRFRSCSSASNPCRQAYIDHSWGLDDLSDVSSTLIDMYGHPPGRQSWDPIAVLVAVRGVASEQFVLDQSGGYNRADFAGANFWTPPNESIRLSKQSILAFDGTYPWYAERLSASAVLDDLLCRPPRK